MNALELGEVPDMKQAISPAVAAVIIIVVVLVVVAVGWLLTRGKAGDSATGPEAEADAEAVTGEAGTAQPPDLLPSGDAGMAEEGIPTP